MVAFYSNSRFNCRLYTLKIRCIRQMSDVSLVDSLVDKCVFLFYWAAFIIFIGEKFAARSTEPPSDCSYVQITV